MWHVFASSVSYGCRGLKLWLKADSASSGLTFSEVLPPRLGANPSDANPGAYGDWIGLCLFPCEVGSFWWRSWWRRKEIVIRNIISNSSCHLDSMLQSNLKLFFTNYILGKVLCQGKMGFTQCDRTGKQSCLSLLCHVLDGVSEIECHWEWQWRFCIAYFETYKSTFTFDLHSLKAIEWSWGLSLKAARTILSL